MQFFFKIFNELVFKKKGFTTFECYFETEQITGPMKYFPILFSFLIFSSTAFSQKSLKNEFTIVFYNVENLFDTIDNPVTKDEEFTPGSEKNWNSERYAKKLEDLSMVLTAAQRNEFPEIIGLAEVENHSVLEDLLKTKAFRKSEYEIVHRDSPDRRGIDVALLYRKDELKSVSSEWIPVNFPFDSSLTTRDILHVSGKASDGRKIHFFVNHWSSRYGGMRESEPKRMYCAVSLRRKIDMLYAMESDPRIVIMGDFNDEPTNKSIMHILQASNKLKNISTGELYNLFYDQHNQGLSGSYNYRGSWNMLDQIIVTHNMINQDNSYSCDYSSGKILKEDWMLYENRDGVKVPDRTYGGPNYFGGISDHLPVYIVLKKK